MGSQLSAELIVTFYTEQNSDFPHKLSKIFESKQVDMSIVTHVHEKLET